MGIFTVFSLCLFLLFRFKVRNRNVWLWFWSSVCFIWKKINLFYTSCYISFLFFLSSLARFNQIIFLDRDILFKRFLDFFRVWYRWKWKTFLRFILPIFYKNLFDFFKWLLDLMIFYKIWKWLTLPKSVDFSKLMVKVDPILIRSSFLK